MEYNGMYVVDKVIFKYNSCFYSQVTLNMLNAQESEMDVEGLNNEMKLEFESSTEEVTT